MMYYKPFWYFPIRRFPYKPVFVNIAIIANSTVVNFYKYMPLAVFSSTASPTRIMLRVFVSALSAITRFTSAYKFIAIKTVSRRLGFLKGEPRLRKFKRTRLAKIAFGLALYNHYPSFFATIRTRFPNVLMSILPPNLSANFNNSNVHTLIIP